MSNPAQRRSTSLAIISTGFVVLWIMIAAAPFLWTLWGSFKVQEISFLKQTGPTHSMAYGLWWKQGIFSPLVGITVLG